MNITYVIERAIRVATCSSYKQRVGAVLLKKNRIVAVGFNKIKTSPKLSGYFSVHAEADAIRHESGDTLVVVRLSKRGELAMSLPCSKCLRMIIKKGVKTIYWIGWDGCLYRTKIQKGGAVNDKAKIIYK